MAKFNYYLVENSFVARVKSGEAERLTVDDERWDWVPYPDLWDVCTNGRNVSEEEAMGAARYFSEEAKKKETLEKRMRLRERRERAKEQPDSRGKIEAPRPEEETRFSGFNSNDASIPEEAFLSEIRRNFHDNSPRLKYADWVASQGDPLGEFIRLQIERSHASETDPDSQELREREESLLRSHYEQATPAIPEEWRLPASRFHRGFVCELELLDEQWSESKYLGFLESRYFAPRKLCIKSNQNKKFTVSHARKLKALPSLVTLDELAVSCVVMEPTAVRLLVSSPFLKQLKKLGFSYSRLGPSGAKALAESASFDSLQSLEITVDQLGAEGVQALAAGGPFTHISDLCLHSSRIGAEGVMALAREPGFPELTTLMLGSNSIGDEGVRALAKSPHLRKLTHLFLGGNRITDEGLGALAGLANFPALATLELGSNQITADGIRIIASSPVFSSLENLRLDWNQISDEGVHALASSPHMFQLRTLTLMANRITDEGARALAAATNLPKLTKLDLRSNEITSEGTQALADSVNLDGVDELLA